jgi:hypothetical protein
MQVTDGTGREWDFEMMEGDGEAEAKAWADAIVAAIEELA